jgi:hypothetical protein
VPVDVDLVVAGSHRSPATSPHSPLAAKSVFLTRSAGFVWRPAGQSVYTSPVSRPHKGERPDRLLATSFDPADLFARQPRNAVLLPGLRWLSAEGAVARPSASGNLACRRGCASFAYAAVDWAA